LATSKGSIDLKLGIIKGKLKSDVDISAKLQFSTDFVPKMYLIAS
jgi:hypothetical protein